MDRAKPILVTGSAGRIGRAAVSALVRAGWRVRGLDCRPTSGASESLVGDLADFAVVERAASGTAAIIHLGGVPDDEDFMTRLLPSNIIGSHNVLEAARSCRVERVLLASTGQVNWWQQLEGPWPIRATDGYTPKHWYSVGKIFLESAGRAFARNFDMTILGLRLGFCPRTPQHLAEVGTTELAQDVYLSPPDAGRFFVRAIEASIPPGFHLVFVCSRPTHHTVFDPQPAKALLDWDPQDQWPAGAYEDLEKQVVLPHQPVDGVQARDEVDGGCGGTIGAGGKR